MRRVGEVVAGAFRVYSTCPQSKDSDEDRYLRQVVDVARWSEQAGCHGILVYTDNQLVDPWLVAQVIVQQTDRIRPLVAVQPVALHPYSAAKMVTSIAFLHGRAVDLNMLAGGFRNDLVALGDTTPHDDRYERTAEYTTIVSKLLEGERVTLNGRFYQVSNLELTPGVPEELRPNVLISGSSPAGMAAAEQTGATAVRYPRHVDEEARDTAESPVPLGIRVGIVARPTANAAWDEAHTRFPEDRRGQIKHQLAMSVSDSHWHGQLSTGAHGDESESSEPYWLGPFNNSHTFCPYLVGDYATIARTLAGYVDAGFGTVILDIPTSPEELDHIAIVLEMAGNS